MSRNWRRGAPCRQKGSGSSFADVAEFSFVSAAAAIAGSDSAARAGLSTVVSHGGEQELATGFSREHAGSRRRARFDTERAGPTCRRRK